MKAGRSIVLALLACALMRPAARAEDAAPTPVQLVNGLQNLQAEIAQGDAAAYAAQPKTLRDISEAFAAVKPDVWHNSREARAAIIYTLSGGQPRVVMRLIESGNLPPDDEKLMRGALAYVLGHEADARQMLGEVDPRSLDPALGGQIAFVQSVLLSGIDVKKAIGLLDLARLLMPGGLVEEAALRREVFMVGDKAHDGAQFLTLAAQYLGRFPKSPYADSFLRSFGATLVRLRLAEDVANFPKLETLAQNLSRDDRRGLFLTIARAALVAGKIAMADVAASKALTLAQADSPDEACGKLYQGAARTLTDQYDSALAELQALDPKKLSKRDVALLAAARMVAKRVYEKAAPPPTSPPPPAGGDSASATIALVEAALAKSQTAPGDGVP